MHLSDPYQQRYEPHLHCPESAATTSHQSWRVQDHSDIGYYPLDSYDAQSDFKNSCFSEERAMTAQPPDHDVQGTSTAFITRPSYNPALPESFNEDRSNNRTFSNDFTSSNSRLNVTVTTNPAYTEGGYWNQSLIPSSALAPYKCYASTDTVSTGINTFGYRASHSQSRGSRLVPPDKRARHSCGLGCKDLLQDSEILQHMNQCHQDKKGGSIYCLDHKHSISWKNYARHIRTTHLELKPFKCDMCRRSFGQEFNAKRHMEESCPARTRT